MQAQNRSSFVFVIICFVAYGVEPIFVEVPMSIVTEVGALKTLCTYGYSDDVLSKYRFPSKLTPQPVNGVPDSEMDTRVLHVLPGKLM
jgi:hypothetical protein